MAEPVLPLPKMPETPDQTVRGCLGVVAALIVVGAVAELIHNISPTGALLFVAAVILGYAMTGGKLKATTDFFNTIQGKTA